MTIYFVRHGETKCNVRGVYYGSLDVPVTERGRQQAERVGGMLKDVAFGRVIISGLQRTRQTARYILDQQKQGVSDSAAYEAFQGLNEMAFGQWEGLHYTEVREKYPEDYRAMMADWVNCPPTGGEGFLDFRDRVLKTWNSLDIQGNENVLYVGHGGAIRVILCELLGMEASGIWHLDICQGTYTKVEIQGNFPVLKGMNLERREILE